MLLLEYQGKALLKAAGIPVPEGVVVRSGTKVQPLGYPVAAKAQVSAGGRGKAGGVVKASSEAGVRTALRQIFNSRFGDERPREVLIEPWLEIAREVYLSVTVDAAAEGYSLFYSPTGGINVEQNESPVRYGIGPLRNFRAHRLRELLRDKERDETVRERVIGIAGRLVALAARSECITVEINPLAVLVDGSLIAADAKIVRDEHAAFRVSDIAKLREQARKRERSAVAKALAGDLMVVWLDGEVGLISGGAGMTMAAMDLIADCGGRPACFLDCSNNPTPDGYRLAFELLDRDPSIKVILVSIFGGLTQMDRVAPVMCTIMKERPSRKPVVFRLNGTNAARANEILSHAGLRNRATLEEAVKEAVALSRKQTRA